MDTKHFMQGLGGVFGKWAGRLLVGTILAWFCKLVFGADVPFTWFVVGFIFGDVLCSTTSSYHETIDKVMKIIEDRE